MKKLYTLCMGLLLATAGVARAQVLPEGFETLDLAAGDWTASQAEGASASQKWAINTYAKETAQFPKNIPTLDVCGDHVLKCTASGSFSGSGTPPDNKLVSPEITVGENAILTFLMANNFAGNAAAAMTEEGKTHFSVYVSPNGTADADSFTDLVYDIAPKGLNTWTPVCIDLSAYKGKTIRLQFRCHMAQMCKVSILNTLYIDNIDLTADKSTDIKLSNLTGLFRGTITRQPLSVDVTNNGATAIGSFTMTVRVNDATASTETITKSLAPGEQYTHEFEASLAPGENTVEVEAAVGGDALAFNNTVSGAATIDTAVELPFSLADDGTQDTQFVTTRKGTTSRPAGWMYFTNYKQWIHTATSTGAKAYLYTATPLKLEKGAIKVSAKATLAKSSSADLGVFLTRRTDKFGEAVETSTFTAENGEKMFLVTVPEEGDYYVAFGVKEPVSTAQFKLDALTIGKADNLPDLEIGGIISPLSALAGEPAPLTVEIRNGGAGTAIEPKVSYTAGEETITESIPSVEGGTTVTHTFTTPLTLGEGSHEITVTAQAGGDSNSENDSKKVTFTSYAAKTLPYSDSFEKDADSALWRSVNANGDASSWTISDGYEFDGTHIASLAAATDAHNDWIISPAIALTEDFDGRLSFYYGAGGNPGESHIKAYLTASSDTAEIAEGTAMLDLDCNAAGVSYASAPVKGLEAGNYYIAFHAADGRQPLMIDDVRIDDKAEVAVTGLSVTNPEAAYDHEPSTVKLALHNYGKQAVSGAKAAYSLYSYHADSAAPELVETVEETIDEEIPAEADYTYSFKKQITYPLEAAYIVKAAGLFPETADTDAKNNSYQANASQRLATMPTPALWDMEISDHLAGYTFDEGESWKVAAVNPYDGARSLFHKGEVVSENGDKVALNRVHLKAGKYQLSFFWQTTRGMEGDEYKQSFDVVMGETPATMDKVLASIADRTAADKKHAKEMMDLTIDKDGNYFIGFNLKKGAAQGQIVIDNVRIEQPVALYDLTARKSKYEADFAGRAEEWQHYHPLANVAQQWTAETDKLGLTCMQAVEFSNLGVHYAASYLQAPALQVKAGNTYKVTLFPEILGLAQTGKELKGTEAIVVYRSQRDLPGEFKEIGRAVATDKAEGYSMTFTPEESGLCYLSLLPYCEEDAAFRVHSFKVEMTAAAEDAGWEDAGTCSFTEPAFSALGLAPQTMEGVLMQRNTKVENQYRLIDAYEGWKAPEGKEAEYSFTASKMTPIVFDIVDNKYVYVHPFNTGWAVDGAELKGEVSCHMQAKNLLDNNLDLAQIIALAPGCLATLDYDRITAKATFAYYGYEEPPVFLTSVSGSDTNFAANKQGEFLIMLPEEMIPDPNEGWESVGKAVMTEVFVSGCFSGEEHQTLECELQRKESNPAIYRLVNPYAEWKNPDATKFSYDTERPRYMVIHTESAPNAWFEEFATGVSGDDGMISGQCYAADFISAMTLEKALANVPAAFGRFEENVFTFPSASFTYQGRDLPNVFTRFADTPNSLTRCNADNAFKVEFKLPTEGVEMPEVDFDVTGEAEYYNLQGLRLQRPVSGQPVIVREGTRTYKAIIR